MNFHFKSHSESANGLARSNQPPAAQYHLHSQREPQLQSSIYQYHGHNQSAAPAGPQRHFHVPQHQHQQQQQQLQPPAPHHNHHYTSQSQAPPGYPSPAQRHFHNHNHHHHQPPPPQQQQPAPHPGAVYNGGAPTAQTTAQQQQPPPPQPPAQQPNQQHYQQQQPPAPADRRYQSQLLQPATHHQPQQLQPIMNQSTTNPGLVSLGSTDGSIIREFSDSQQSLDRLFNPPTTEASVPLRQRNLPSSFFNPRPLANGVRGDLHCRSTSFDLRPAQNSVHMRTQSVLAPMTGILSDSTGSNGLLHSSGYYSSSSNSLQQPVESLSRQSSGTIAAPQQQQQQPAGAGATATQQDSTQTLANPQQQQPPPLAQRQPQQATAPASAVAPPQPQQQYTNFSASYAQPASINGHSHPQSNGHAATQQNGRNSYVSEFNSNNYFMETTDSQEQAYNQAQVTCTYNNGDLYSNQTSVYPTNQVAFSPTSDQGVFDWNETSM